MGRGLNLIVFSLVGTWFGYLPQIAVAGLEESTFVFNNDRAAVDFDVRGVARRDVLVRLFDRRDIKLQWTDPGIGDEPITGTFRGALPNVARRLLEDLNFVLVYDRVGEEARLTRVLILGRGSGKPSPGLAALERAIQPAARPTLPQITSSAGAPDRTADDAGAQSLVSERKPGAGAAPSLRPAPLTNAGPSQKPPAPNRASMVPPPPASSPTVGAASLSVPAPNPATSVLIAQAPTTSAPPIPSPASGGSSPR